MPRNTSNRTLATQTANHMHKKNAIKGGQSSTHGDSDSAPEWIVGNIAEASKGAQQVFLILISLLSYCAVTILSTADRQIVLNSTVQLPLLNSPVSLEGFFILAPSVSVLVYAYLQLYLQRLKGLIQQLREYGPIQPRRLYPWALAISEDPEPGSVGLLQKGITSFCLWWLLPFVLLLFAFSSVRKHSPGLSYVVGAYPLLGLFAVVYFWRKYAVAPKRAFLPVSIWLLATIVLSLNIFLVAYLIPRARLGSMEGTGDQHNVIGSWHKLLRTWTCVDLSYQVLVTEQKKEYDTLWVDLENAHLKLANLKGAHLQGANLKGTTLRGALLEGADFDQANLAGVDLSYAKLRNAVNLNKDDLCKGKTLFKAEMDGALEGAMRSSCSEILSEKSQE
jgi:hypothetical protein